MGVNLKFQYNGVFRRCVLESLSYNSVVRVARELFNIPDTHKISLTWFDEEKDLITVSSEPEFEVFLIQNNNCSPLGTVLKFGIVAAEINEPKISNLSNGSTMENLRPSIPFIDEQIIHENVSCDGCGQTPIIGFRYKCTVRNDYDLCPACEIKAVPSYPMLKIYVPDTTLNIHSSIRGRHNFKVAFASNVENPKVVVHDRVKCDECGTKPLVGPRFKCTVRDNFDLCLACESKSIQPFPMIKFYSADISVRSKGWHPHGKKFRNNLPHSATGRRGCDFASWRRNCGEETISDTITIASEVAKSMGLNEQCVENLACAAQSIIGDVEEQMIQETLELSLKEADIKTADASDDIKVASVADINAKEQQPFNPSTVRGYALKPMARFVGDITIPDVSSLPPNVDFMKIWLVRNDGSCDWPAGVTLITAGGDHLCDPSATSSVNSIKIGEETHVSIALRSPKSPGRYVSYFRLQAADGTIFGQKLWVDIRVQGGPSDQLSPLAAISASVAAAAASFSSPTPFGQVTQEAKLATVSATSTPLVVQFPSPEPSPNLPIFPVAEINPSNKDDQLWEAEREQLETDWKIELDALRGMGFYNIRENIILLKRHTKFSFNRFPHLQGKPFNDSLSTILDSLLN